MSEDHEGQGAGPNSAVLQAFEPYLDAIADRIAARMNAGRERMVNQGNSDLGPRKHRAAVKRRLANDEGGAGISPDGRRFLLTPEAVREELAGKSGRAKPKGAAAKPSEADAKPAKSRARDLGDFERKIMTGLRAVEDR